MKFNPKLTSKALFTIVGGAVLINPAFAQEQASEELEEVVVTGLRGSLKASMETKRDALGVVDAINAEDIGKFPDTNLSEALQRITGVSIDRRNGEGATVTARGFGPQFNMVTLNGRQMPSADAYGGGELVTGGFGAQGRSLNFSNLAAEAISAVEVYKTGRADIATGGIGATINVRTARPLDNDGMVLNLGAKIVNDTTTRVGDDFTPEVSGIFSYATEDKMFGIGVSASYQKRDLGSSTSTVNDWHIQPWDASNGGINAANRTGAPLYYSDNGTPTDLTDDINAQIVNAPANGQLYGIPNDIRYAFSDMERERVNVQGAIQFAPMDTLTLTVDYTWARNELVEDRGEQTIWLQRNGFYYLEFDTGNQVATPMILREYTGANKDFGYEQQHREQRNDLNSFGFNATWDLADNFTLGFDHRWQPDRVQPCRQDQQQRHQLRARPDPGLLELLGPGVPVQHRPAGCDAYSVPDELGGLCRHWRRLRRYFRQQLWFADSAHPVPGTEHRDQTVAHRRQVRLREWRPLRLRRGNARDGDAPALVRFEPDHG
jgi:TonB-dependent receptor